MNTHGQILLDHRHTTATALRSYAWVNLNIRATSLFRFVARIGGELVPRGIGNAFRQAMIFDHPRDVQVLKDNDTKPIDQVTWSSFLSTAPRLLPAQCVLSSSWTQ